VVVPVFVVVEGSANALLLAMMWTLAPQNLVLLLPPPEHVCIMMFNVTTRTYALQIVVIRTLGASILISLVMIIMLVPRIPVFLL